MFDEKLRRDPFRILFPLAIVLAWLAVLPWVLFGTGVIRAWLGVYHALTMTQGFLVAAAVGFLGTMLPRRTGGPPMSSAELVIAVVGLCVMPVALIASNVTLAEAACLIVLADLVQFAFRRLRRAARPMPAPFVFLPIGLACGIAGAVLVGAGALGAPLRVLVLGRSFAQEGLMLALVLAVAPMLASIIGHDRGQLAPSRRREQRLHLAAGALFLASFAVQHMASERAGLLMRGVVVAAELIVASQLWRWPSAPGLHRRLFWLALACVPLGLLAAGVQPNYRIAWMHLTFVSGFSLLVFAVTFHVTFMHTGREALAKLRPWPVAVVGALVLLATLARASAERLAGHYFEALAVASSLWLLGAVIWGVFVLRLLAVKKLE
jgi:uncharacterized protein involved in response to NO